MPLASSAVREIVSFWRRQRRNWRIVVTRTVFNRFFNQLTMEYTNIYVRALGASPVQLGSVNSLAGLGSTLLAIPSGWMHDKYSLKKLFSCGCGLVAIASLFYALASEWVMIIPAIVLARVAMRFHCVTICDVSLKSESRATGRSLCEGLGSAPSIMAPTVAVLLITFFGGINAEGIRPLYWIQFVARCTLLLFVATQLTEIIRADVGRNGGTKQHGFLGDFLEVFEYGSAVKRWIILSTISMFTMNMITPFWYPFANEIKGANQFIIGGMATVGILVRIVFSTPLGRVADRIGRKKVFYILTPIVCAATLVFVFARSPEILIVAGFLRGFDIVSRIVIVGSMTPELVPSKYVGRWRGILGLFGGLASIIAPVVGGIIWETLGPAYVLLIPLAVDLLIRLPLMTTIPETLKTGQ